MIKGDLRLPKPSTIAVDGPAGSGKSTICEHLAQKYGYRFVDTGVFYRAMTYLVLKAHTAFDELDTLAEIAHRVVFQIEYHPGISYRVIANGEDVTDHLRTKEVERAVSVIAQMGLVRQSLLPVQRDLAAQGNIILAGRDIGTVVLPDADLKLYIDASLEERARRRHLQTAEKSGNQQDVQNELARRDKIDSEREIAPLTIAEGAIYVLTDGKTIDEVVREISHLIENWTP
jgi:cytidylate kinase